MVFRNVSFATVGGLRDVLVRGAALRVRGEDIREIRNKTTVLQRPCERCLLLPHRANNVFASLAETFWVFAGRDDVGWLQHYLTRAPEFSDDGLTWHAAYGPRLRNWNGVDQLDEARKLLIGEPLTRRCVMSLYDPGRDFVPSKDIPCNNWLHWLVRDDQLHLNIAIRSNDIMWGFSGINAFEWSILHEMVAYWIGVPVGEATFFASSFHLYSRHLERARQIVDSFKEVTPYDYGISSPRFRTPWNRFDETLRMWFDLEEQIRRSADVPTPVPSALGDPLLDGALTLVRLYNGSRQGWSIARTRQELAALPETDFTVAAYEFLGRKYPELLDNIPQPAVAEFFGVYCGTSSPPAAPPKWNILPLAIKALHRRKNAAYADAWKRRGELTSILANIARKVDRLTEIDFTKPPLADESVLDNAVDLFVYVTKYRLFLLERVPEIGAMVLQAGAPRPLSDHVINFETLVDQASFGDSVASSFTDCAGEISALFEDLHAAASASTSMVEIRLERANRLGISSVRLLNALAINKPRLLDQLWRNEVADIDADDPGATV